MFGVLRPFSRTTFRLGSKSILRAPLQPRSYFPTSTFIRTFTSNTNAPEYQDKGSASGNPSFATITTKPTTPEEIAQYEKLRQRDMEQETQYRLIQDMEDDGVFIDERPEARNIEVKMNPDGSFTFTSTSSGASSTTAPTHNAEGDENVLAVGEGEVEVHDPRLILSLKCDICETRLTKSIPKRSYEKGVVLLRCDGCNSNHLIADNLGWFADSSINVEMFMREKGQKVIKSTLDEDLDDETRKIIEQAMRETSEKDLSAPAIGIIKNNDKTDEKQPEAAKTLA